jgi:hypothetical protein
MCSILVIKFEVSQSGLEKIQVLFRKKPHVCKIRVFQAKQVFKNRLLMENVHVLASK